MPKKKKKSWKERQRDRQLKEQNAQQSYQLKREKAKKNKPRKWPKGKIVVGIIILFIVLGSYLIIQNPDTPFTTIYIRSDGSVDPNTAPIIEIAENNYALTDDIYGSIVIEKDNIVLDGANHLLNGNKKDVSKGIELNEKSYVTIKDLEITNFGSGIHVFLSSNNIISQNTLSNNNNNILLDYSLNNEIVKNNISTQYGLTLASSSDNRISENIIENCEGGIGLSYSSNNIIAENQLSNSLSGIGLASYSSNNSVSGNIISNCEGGIALSSSSENLILENELANGLGGIGLSSFSMNNSIFRNQIEYIDEGIILNESPSNLITGNLVSNCAAGISLSYSLNNTINENDVMHSQQYGISLSFSEDNYVFHNVFYNNNNQVYSYDSVSYWDNGFPSGGNYWSDYEEKYPIAEEIESSGIWNEPYQIIESEYDNFPLKNQ
jgi:parallel beta-helix repeat protein